MSATQYIVAATPRTGSSLLCECLCATRVAGFPNEPFAPDFRWMWRRRWGLPDSVAAPVYAQTALRHGTSPNGIVAFKIQWMHVAVLACDLGRSEGNVLSWLLPSARFVNIVRRDRRAQALSWFRAIATNQWWQFEEREAPAPPSPGLEPVRRLEWHIEAQQNAWLAHFAARGIVPLTVEYEALDEDFRHEIGRVLEFLGLDASPARALPPPLLSRQADAITAAWRERLEPAAARSS